MSHVLSKAHVKGYSRRDGSYVKPHERDAGEVVRTDIPPHYHAHDDDAGKPVVIKYPTHASLPSTWHNPDAVATFVPNGDAPLSLNGVPLRSWRDHPTTVEGWDFAEGIDDNLDEPAFTLPEGKKAAAGVIIEEPDGRVWLVAPTNRFGGYKASFPKGTADMELSLQGTALKECFEETGLKIEITGFVMDIDRTTSKARFYRAKRVGGTPIDMGWESQGVHLVPKGELYGLLNMWTDHSVAEAVGAGPAPKPPEKPPVPKWWKNHKGLF
jgi:8-oxo-dGTP pyrophosphatase MutT (NUDIX family)